MYRIVAKNPDGSEFTIYDPVGAGALPVLAPRLTEELNEAGSLEFALVIGHEAYEQLIPKVTYVTAYLDGEEIFYGRMLSPDTNPLLGQIQYTCAGALSLLQDSELPADGKKSDGTIDAQTMTAEAFFRRCINNHNADIGNDPRRTFRIGIIDHPDSDTEREYQIGSYTDTLSALRSNLLDYYGGFLRVRPDGEGGHYIDWVDQYGDVDEGTLEIGGNILSIANRIASEDLVTAIRPVGKDGLTLSGSPTIDLFDADSMREFGKIVKSVTFSNCETEDELQSAADDFVARVNASYHISSEIKLVDMVFVDGADHGVNLGDTYTEIFGFEGIELTVGTRSRDFENPQNDSVSLKSPRDFEGDSSGGSYGNHKAGSSSGSSSLSSRSARNSAAGGYAYKYIHEFQDELQLNTKKIAINAEQLELHADQLVETANDFIRLSHKEETLEGKMGVIEGTGVIQNSEHITSIAGKFRLDPESKKVELIEGTEFVVHDQNGATVTVGKRITDLDAKADQLGNRVAVFEGSALWSQRDNITGVVGQFEVRTGTDGKKRLVIVSGGGMKIEQDEVEYGVYNEKSLTAGVIVNKINGGTATISAKNIILDGTTKISDVFKVTSTGVSSYKTIVVTDGTNYSSIGPNVIVSSTVGAREHLVIGGSRDITPTVLDGMIKTAEVSGSKLTLTRFDGTSLDFSSATTLSGAWSGSSATNKTYTVTASPQNKKHSVNVAIRLSGTAQYSNCTAEFGTYDNNGNFTRQGYAQAFLQEIVSGTSSYVNISTASSGGNIVARLSTTATYNAGRNAVGLGSFSFASQSTGQTKLSISTTGKATNASKSINLYVTSDGWSGGSNVVRLRDGSASGTSRASYTVSIPSVGSTSWVNTSGRTWRADLTIGGVTRSSGTKDFQYYYDEGYEVTGISVDNPATAGQAAGTGFIQGYTNVGTFASRRGSPFYLRFTVQTHGKSFKKYFKID